MRQRILNFIDLRMFLNGVSKYAITPGTFVQTNQLLVAVTQFWLPKDLGTISFAKPDYTMTDGQTKPPGENSLEIVPLEYNS